LEARRRVAADHARARWHGLSRQERLSRGGKARADRLPHGGGKKGEHAHQFEASWIFEAQGEKTKLTLQMVFASAEVREMVVKQYNAIEGGEQTLDRLGEYLAKIHAEENR
jgi:Activator of Hsp90 ATPase homolog 1-like protein